MQNEVSNKNSTDYPVWLNNFVQSYQDLSIDNLELLESIYHKDVTFVDPIHKVEGFDNLDILLQHTQNPSQCMD